MNNLLNTVLSSIWIESITVSRYLWKSSIAWGVVERNSMLSGIQMDQVWLSVRPPSSCSHSPSSARRGEKIKWKSPWVGTETRRSLNNYLHGQNRLNSVPKPRHINPTHRSMPFIKCEAKIHTELGTNCYGLCKFKPNMAQWMAEHSFQKKQHRKERSRIRADLND